MGFLKNSFVKHGEKFVIKHTHDKPFAKKWVTKIYNFWSIVLKVVATILVIIVVRKRAFVMIDTIGFEKTIMFFVVVITIITIKNARFIRAEEWK